MSTRVERQVIEPPSYRKAKRAKAQERRQTLLEVRREQQRRQKNAERTPEIVPKYFRWCEYAHRFYHNAEVGVI